MCTLYHVVSTKTLRSKKTRTAIPILLIKNLRLRVAGLINGRCVTRTQDFCPLFLNIIGVQGRDSSV